MRTFSIFRPASFRTIGGWICAAACVLSSCVDDTFDKYGQGISPYLTFEVEVPASWTGGQAACSAAGQSDISIKRMTRSDGGKPLYLVTEISETAADTAASGVISRGTPVDTQNFPGTFGLFAFGTEGASWTEGGTEKTSYENMEVKKGTNGVWMPQTETLWQWPGKGQIAFYAYSPRIGKSSPVLPPAEEPAGEGDENAPAGEQELSFSYSVGEDNRPVLAYTVPSDVTKQIDLMTAHDTYAGDGSQCAHLTFSHALTAVTIKTGEEMLKGTIKSVTISGVYGEGTYQIGAEGWTIPQGDDKKREFVVTLGNDSEPDAANEEPDTDTGKGRGMYQEGNTSIVEGEYTFMMIPQELHEGAELTVVFTDEFSQTEWTLTADLKDQIWPMGKMVTYSINSTGIVVKPVVTWKINRDVLPNGGQVKKPLSKDGPLYEDMKDDEKKAYFPVSGYLPDVEISSCVEMTQADKPTVKLELPFEIQYSFNGETEWESPTDKKVWTPAPLEATRNETVGVAKKGVMRLPAQPVFTDTQDEHFSNVLNSEKGSKDAPWDLVNNNPRQKESANCYIVNNPGYYTFPAAYGNTYRDDDPERAYIYKEPADRPIENGMGGFILEHFVGYDNEGISFQGDKIIPGVHDAVIVWQDSPDLVTDVELNNNGWVRFRILEETMNQGNAVIAVRNSGGKILWSWHIWVTNATWDDKDCQTSAAKNVEGMPFLFAPCNLGYCDSHDGNEKRPIYVRFEVTMPDGTKEVLTDFNNDALDGVPTPENGVFKFTQPEIVASIAGDNTYYQWGRKDPMLPGVYNADIRGQARGNEQFDMENKMFYSTTEYRFTSMESTKTIGDAIQNPHRFILRPNDGTPDANYKRRHWHNGEHLSGKGYKNKSIMNFWNTQLNQNGTTADAGSPNNIYVIKTIYDPSPAGFKIPPPTAFSEFTRTLGSYRTKEDCYSFNKHEKGGIVVGWELKDSKEATVFKFPATGLRDMGTPSRTWDKGTWPAHSKLTFIATSGFHYNKNEEKPSSSCLLFSIDDRSAEIEADVNINGVTQKLRFKWQDRPVGAIYGTNNSYGFTLRPVHDMQHNIGTR